MTHDGGVDAAALRALEFSAVIEEIARLCSSVVGSSVVLSLVPRLGERAWAQAEQALVEDTTGFFMAGGDFSFGGAIDTMASIEQAKLGASLSPVDLRQFADTERKIRTAVASIGRGKRPSGPLRALASGRRNTDELITSIDRSIEEEGRVSDDASPKLASIRRQHRELGERVRDRCRSIVASAELGKLLSEPIVTVRSGRYVVPVRSEHAAHFPGVVLDQSASGATVFMEPLASVEANNRLRTLEADEEREIARILAELSALVARKEEEALANVLLLGRLDSAGARARFGIARNAGAPTLTSEPALRIVHGRHPLLRREAVPLDFEIGESFDAVVISGPNMGGKTVVLKTAGLLCLLAYAGIPIPASATSTVGEFTRVDCVIGDEQSIAQDLSSFSAHLQALKAAASGANPKTLVLVDEIGSGTEPGAGAALAQAFIEALIRSGAKVAVTTHFTQLKTFAATHDRVRNASMLFDPVTYQPTYVFALGVPGQSLAFALARSLALDPKTIARAETLVGIDAQNLERTFERLAQERDKLKQIQAELEEQRSRSQRAEQTMRQRIAALEQEKDAFERRATVELTRAIEDVRQTLTQQAEHRSATAARQASKPLPSSERLLEQTLQEIRRSLGLETSEHGSRMASFHSGDEIYVKSFDATGIVAEVYERELLVAIGNLKMLVSTSDVVKRASGLHSAKAADVAVRPSRPRSTHARTGDVPAHLQIRSDTSPSVDVRGMRVDEAWPLIDKALDNAVLGGLSELRILHGKGTGRLARGIREFLDEHPQVESVSHAPEREGGTGITIVRLV